MKNLILILAIFCINKLYAQNNGLKSYYAKFTYTSLYQIDLDTDYWKDLGNYNTGIIIDINELGSGRIIIYFKEKTIFYVKSNYRINYSDNSARYFFTLTNGAQMRLGITPDNKVSCLSIIYSNNTTLTFCP